ncbi:MAG: 30S ribosomal protein S12 methylthiotransferase RimO [Epsilonproteobacteria bacterium]|nr:30S ribosomal protein S12 methylthiotransferase RimO [Campylobacterota bacterium]OIO14135.1 MAG: ribosomal protein S12 methylthiotransferase RimO [Helicobacteraceae bacterium CG1_02_36_14]PIP09682.1 MAG: 30S ribosomal protein S12 methylthiotransferase RimO [Sulfurimonas sp. CG23_combo_of_CG06-09_8_20_14_all_36_33]PIS26227.1 MAG: 30S ribosomal protein S12 methylthiotransferase RimO [Sulfurimonas sp. CG08_land_8_20_14_0_20_36_33]PIU34311.1 MAG: 30S ribosomal protein S12 methylthiotransferase R
MSNKLHIVSLGCTKNLVDTEVMMGKLQNFELTDNSGEADVIIVNTCGFIDAAKAESVNTVLNLHEGRKEDSVLVMAGCLSERYKEDLMADMPEVDIFTGVGDYDRIDDLLSEKKSRFSEKVFLIDGAERVVTGSTYHAYVKLSEGCNQTCSFCAIPSFKGKLNSRNLDSIAKEVEGLVAKGYYDFSFVSQDSSSYLRDQNIKDGLSLLIQRIELIEGVKSARILYLYPSTTTIQLLKNIAKSEIFHNYFDMPIQHINDEMLHMMRRGFGKDKTLELLNFMRSLPNSFVRTSFIVGHPNETEEMFEEMCEFASSFGFDRINVFSYSDEETTPAYDMSNKISAELIASRAEILGEIASECTELSLRKEVGQDIELVIDGESEEHEYLLSARKLLWAPEIDGEIYVNDRTKEEELDFGVIYRAKVTDLIGNILTATVDNA